MRRHSVGRLVFALLAAFAALSAPATALAHGLAHQREGPRGHYHAAAAPAPRGVGEVETADDPAADHPLLHCQECAPRSGPVALTALTAVVVTLATPAESEVRVTPPGGGAIAPPAAHRAPPDQPRAPPRR